MFYLPNSYQRIYGMNDTKCGKLLGLGTWYGAYRIECVLPSLHVVATLTIKVDRA